MTTDATGDAPGTVGPSRRCDDGVSSSLRGVPAPRWGRARAGRRAVVVVLLAVLGAAAGAAERPASAPQRASAQPPIIGLSNVHPNDLPVPRLLPPCAPGKCPFAGRTVRVISTQSVISAAILEVKGEYEAATGARLEIELATSVEHFPTIISDMTSHAGRYDASLVGSWWLGDLVAGGHLLPYDAYYGDPRFPKWNIDDVLPGPRRLLSYGGRKYMVAYDHDAQVMYYRRDLLDDPRHQAAFRQRYGYPLAVPQTWAQLRDAAEYFDGKDLSGDGRPDSGIVMALRPGSQSMFVYMSLSAPFVVGPANPQGYWFDPATMRPWIDSPGHLRALETLIGLARCGPREMLQWEPGAGQDWSYFLAGRAAFALTWGDLGALAEEPGSSVKGRTGTAQMPGTHAYYDVGHGAWVRTEQVNRVGNTSGGSWAGVISRYSKSPEAAYFLFALLASREKSQVYAARGWDGIDPGRSFHFLPPEGTGSLETYLKAGWNEADVRDYLGALFRTFNERQQLPYLRIPGTYSYWLALDLHLGEALSGQLSPAAALQASAVDFEEITIRHGRERQREAYRASLRF